MTYKIAYLPGDGAGPEAGAAGLSVLEAAAAKFGLSYEVTEGLIGGAGIDEAGSPFPEATEALVKASDAVLLAAVGGPKWDKNPAHLRPELGLLRLRKSLGVYANLRPIKPIPAAAQHSPVKADRLAGVDLVFVRELIGGMYFGPKSRTETEAQDLCIYTVAEIERVARKAGDLARTRKHKVTSVDKANVLETSRLWRATVERIFASEYADVTLEHVLVDAMAMKLITEPVKFDVIVTENLFGDILTDEAAVLCGSLGCPPSASIGEGTRGLYEPIHGSAPDIAGQGLVNPTGTILSIAWMLRLSLNAPEAAGAIEAAVEAALESGIATRDLGGSASTAAFAAAVTARL